MLYSSEREFDGSKALRALGRPLRAFTLIEVIVACSVIAIAFGGIMHAMILLNRQAMLSRIQTNARVVVQRNIERALAEKFTPIQIPEILELTDSSGKPWNDDGSSAPVAVVVENGGSTVTIPGVLNRIVTQIANPNGADIRRVTFSLSYPFRGRTLSYSASTIRSRD
ncbi:MAG: hypothetical protein RL088_1855 [Verrucomicrobiota bacterium]|jgi:prepilin-type N-terminal cleavage/methylation domain-containing protein